MANGPTYIVGPIGVVFDGAMRRVGTAASPSAPFGMIEEADEDDADGYLDAKCLV